MFLRSKHVSCRHFYLYDLDVTGREPSRYSILHSFPPSSRQRARDADQLPGLKAQSALVLLSAERVQTPTQRSRHRKRTSLVLFRATPSITFSSFCSSTPFRFLLYRGGLYRCLYPADSVQMCFTVSTRAINQRLDPYWTYSALRRVGKPLATFQTARYCISITT